MKYLKIFENSGNTGNFDVGRFTIAMRRLIGAAESKDVPKFIQIYNSQLKEMLNSPEARERQELITNFARTLDKVKDNFSTEEKREIYLAIFPDLVEKIDKNPELKAQYDI